MFFPPPKKIITGYSLAEIIITIVIIGVVAAFTVPAINQGTHKKEYVAALQKSYAVLNDATEMILNMEGSPYDWVNTSATNRDMYKKYLNSAKICDSKCDWSKINYKNFNGQEGVVGLFSSHNGLILADGSFVAFSATSNKNCNSAQENAGDTNVCFWFHIDINGAKGPNRCGRDVFRFFVTEDGLFPTGTGLAQDIDCTTVKYGLPCTAKVLQEGTMDY